MFLQLKKNWRRTPDERSCLGPFMLLPCSGPWGLDIVRLLRSSEPKVFYPICSSQTQGIFNASTTEYHWISRCVQTTHTHTHTQAGYRHAKNRDERVFLARYTPISSGWLSFPQIFAALEQDTIEKCFGNSWTVCFVNVGNTTLTFWHFLTYPEARHGSFLGRRTSGLLYLSSDPCSGRKRWCKLGKAIA